MNKLLSTTLALSLFAGCADVGGEDDPLGDTIDDGKADSLSSPTNHNDYFFDTRADVAVASGARYHAWQFRLEDEATVHLEAFNPDFVSPSNTVLYLYKKSSGSTWRKITSQPADGHDPEITEALKKGTYRVIVKGKTRQTAEAAALWGTCNGVGCAPPYSGCLFGDGGMSKLPDSYVHLALEEGEPFRFEDFSDPSDGNAAAIVEAWSTATGWAGNIPDLSAVFDDIEGGVVSNEAVSTSSNDQYRLLRFSTRSGKKVAGFFRLADGDIAGTGAIMAGNTMKACFDTRPLCAFGSTIDSLSDEYEIGSRKTVTKVGDLSTLDRQRLMMVGLNAPGGNDGGDAGEALNRFGKITITELTGRESGLGYTMMTFDYQLRDAPGTVAYGLIFGAEGTDVAAEVSADSIERCQPTVRRSPPAL